MNSMNGWFIAVIIIYVLSLGITLGKHGKPQEGTHNFWVSLITVGIFVFLVYKAILTGF